MYPEKTASVTVFASDRSWMLTTATQAVVAMVILLLVALGVGRVVRRKRAIEATWGEEE